MHPYRSRHDDVIERARRRPMGVVIAIVWIASVVQAFVFVGPLSGFATVLAVVIPFIAHEARVLDASE